MTLEVSSITAETQRLRRLRRDEEEEGLLIVSLRSLSALGRVCGERWRNIGSDICEKIVATYLGFLEGVVIRVVKSLLTVNTTLCPTNAPLHGMIVQRMLSLC